MVFVGDEKVGDKREIWSVMGENFGALRHMDCLSFQDSRLHPAAGFRDIVFSRFQNVLIGAIFSFYDINSRLMYYGSFESKVHINEIDCGCLSIICVFVVELKV